MRRLNLFLLVALLSGSLFSQNKDLDLREAVLKGRSSLAPTRPQQLSIIEGAGKIAYVDKNALVIVNAANGKVEQSMSTVAFNKALVAGKLDTITAFQGIRWKSDKEFYFRNKKGEWIYSINKKTAIRSDRKSSDESLENLDEYKTGEIFAYTVENNLYVTANGKTKQVTEDGSYTIVNGKSVHRDEFGIHKGTYWSPSGHAIAYYRMDQSDVTDYPIIDWSSYPAVNNNIKYPMAGGRSHYVTLHVFDVVRQNSIQIKTDGPRDQFLTNVAWSPDGSKIYMAILNRDQNHYKLNEYNAVTGDFIRTLLEEKDEKYTEPQHPMLFVKNDPTRFIWQSRKDGFNHLYLYGTDGKLIRQLTSGQWEVKAVNGFDARGEKLFFHANREKPVNQDFYAVELKNAKVTKLSEGDGFHTVIAAKNGGLFVDNYSSCFVPREIRIIHPEKGTGKTLFKAENPLSSFRTGRWRLFTISNSENSDLYCRMFLPVDFDSTKKYPVLVYLYNGPHSQLVTNTWMANGEVWYQYMAQKGYIVFTLDGRGTNWRGKKWEQAIHRQIGEVEMQDQLKGVEYLMRLPYVDKDRLGVYGWSYGGFMTASLMTRHPDIYKVAVAGGPVIDWRFYEIMYGERYMDRPEENKDGYENNSLLNHIGKLKGKLLMIHGAQDDVVVWQHSIMLQKKAVDLGVQLDYYVYPGHLHNVIGKDRAHLMEKICNYFLDNL